MIGPIPAQRLDQIHTVHAKRSMYKSVQAGDGFLLTVLCEIAVRPQLQAMLPPVLDVADPCRKPIRAA